MGRKMDLHRSKGATMTKRFLLGDRARLAGRAILLGLALTAGSLTAAEENAIVRADAKVEKLFESKVLTEGVSVAPDGMVYFSEITFSHVARDAKGAIEAGHIWK